MIFIIINWSREIDGCERVTTITINSGHEILLPLYNYNLKRR